MILIDSIYINNGGGKILLDYLVHKLQKENVPAFYLFDERCRNDFSDIPANRKLFIKASLSNRRRFYRQKQNQFRKVLCFGNIPPPQKIRAKVYTYFHQRLFLEVPKGTSVKDSVVFKLKSTVWKALKRNTDFWMVQSPVIAKDLKRKLKISAEKVIVMPFYPPLERNRLTERKANSFIYVSSGTAHKNHIFLINAFCSFYDQYKTGNLALTVGGEFPILANFIAEKIKEGYPIHNYGHVDRQDLGEIFPKFEYHVYPSLSESFGLGLLESIECGCKVIASDLPYSYAVCEPSLVFDPHDMNSLIKAFERAVAKDENETKQLIFNEIDQLVNILKNEQN